MDNNLLALLIPATVTVLTALITAYVEITKSRQKDGTPAGTKVRKDTRRNMLLISGGCILLSVVGAAVLRTMLPNTSPGLGNPIAATALPRVSKPVIQQLGNRFYASLEDWGETPIDVQGIIPIGGVVEPFTNAKDHLIVFVCPISISGELNDPTLCNQQKLTLKVTGEWLDTVTLGSQTDACRKFELLVVVANDQAYEAMKQFSSGIQRPALRILLNDVGHAMRLIRIVTESSPNCSA